MGREYTRRNTIFGNIPTYGEILLYDDMEDLLKWTQDNNLGDDVFALDTTIAYNLSKSLHMKTRTTSAAVGDKIGAQRRLYITPSKKVINNCLFYSPDLTLIQFINFRLQFYDGSDVNQANIHFFPNTPKWKYFDSAGALTDVPGATAHLYSGGWHRVAISVDFANKEYLLLTIDHNTYSLANKSIFTSTDATKPHILLFVEIETAGAAAAEIYLDEYLIHEI